MPAKLEKQLKSQARSKGLKGDRADAYVYGTLRKTGWKPTREQKPAPATPATPARRRGSP